ncbi:hypothetical protein GCM10020000_34890 [Streptomyces olivoverticillatus]
MNPTASFYDLSGTADHRDAQIRHALTRLLHWARRVGVQAIAIEDLDFTQDKTREKHGRNKRFRRLISRFPTAKLKARLISMAAEHGLAIVAVDPAYTSRWGGQHWHQPLTTPQRKTTRHDAAEHRDRATRPRTSDQATDDTAPPQHQSDAAGHRTVQARPQTRGRDGNRPPATDRTPGGALPDGTRKRRPSASKTVLDAPSSQQRVQDSLMRTG